MNNFWNNIRRYPSFFISSMAGLIIVMLTSFTSLSKTRTLRFLGIVLSALFLFTIFNIVRTMIAL
jgi:hypothetical protein